MNKTLLGVQQLALPALLSWNGGRPTKNNSFWVRYAQSFFWEWDHRDLEVAEGTKQSAVAGMCCTAGLDMARECCRGVAVASLAAADGGEA